MLSGMLGSSLMVFLRTFHMTLPLPEDLCCFMTTNPSNPTSLETLSHLQPLSSTSPAEWEYLNFFATWLHQLHQLLPLEHLWVWVRQCGLAFSLCLSQRRLDIFWALTGSHRGDECWRKPSYCCHVEHLTVFPALLAEILSNSWGFEWFCLRDTLVVNGQCTLYQVLIDQLTRWNDWPGQIYAQPCHEWTNTVSPGQSGSGRSFHLSFHFNISKTMNWMVCKVHKPSFSKFTGKLFQELRELRVFVSLFFLCFKSSWYIFL